MQPLGFGQGKSISLELYLYYRQTLRILNHSISLRVKLKHTCSASAIEYRDHIIYRVYKFNIIMIVLYIIIIVLIIIIIILILIILIINE